MTARDKKTLQIGGILVAIYLAGFYGFQLWRKGQKSRNDYQQLVKRAERLQQEKLAAENKVLLFEKLTNAFKLDPRKITKETLVAHASAAIQTAAQQSGVKLGPLRETPGRPNGRELSTIIIEGNGPIAAAITLIHKLQTLGYPLIIDSIQMTQGGPGGPGGPRGGGMPPGMNPGMAMPGGMGGGGGPGMLKLNFTVIILNYDQFKAEGPNA